MSASSSSPSPAEAAKAEVPPAEPSPATTKPSPSTMRRINWRRLVCSIILTGVVLVLATAIVIVFWLSRDPMRYGEVLGEWPTVLRLHGLLEMMSGNRIVGPHAINAKRLEIFQEMTKESDTHFFNRLLADPTFTRFENSRIFFRPLRRRVQPARSQTSDQKPHSALWALAELNASTSSPDTVFDNSPESVRALRCVGPHTTIDYEVFLYSPYGDIVGSSALNIEHIPVQVFRFDSLCQHHVALLMCAGDAWEIACPPEAQQLTGGNANHPLGWGTNPSSKQTRRYLVIRMRVKDIRGEFVANYTEVEEELAYRVLEPGQPQQAAQNASLAPHPFRRADMYRKLQSNPYKSVFLEPVS